ncbi:hypothetical protein BT69DRAFT_1232708 [Atractiella rhizophila]|nr:hypothetical protein BT69DRAFT_1232708 [Atractiella rhizophila]
MQGFMMYMSGNSIQIYSLFMLYMLFKNVIGGVMGVNKTFQPLAAPIHAPGSKGTPQPTQSLLPQKAMFVICQLLLVGVGFYKANSMGLLPSREDFSSKWDSMQVVRIL